MPNHTSNRLTLSGEPETIARFLELFTRPEEGSDAPLLDFQKLIPMPAELDIESSSNARLAFDLLGRDDAWRDVAKLPWVVSLGQDEAAECVPTFESRDALLKHLATHLGSDWEQSMDLAVRYASNLARFGYSTWYDWRLKHWGTKWPAYSPWWPGVPYADGEAHLDLGFETAWSSPVPVVEALARHPACQGLSIQLHSLDEGGCFATVRSFSPEAGWSEEELDWAQMAREQFGFECEAEAEEPAQAQTHAV